MGSFRWSPCGRLSESGPDLYTALISDVSRRSLTNAPSSNFLIGYPLTDKETDSECMRCSQNDGLNYKSNGGAALAGIDGVMFWTHLTLGSTISPNDNFLIKLKFMPIE